MISLRPYLTASLPGIGGTIKESCDDFLVEEIPAYQPCGSGDHAYLIVEKRGITTLEAIRRIARHLNVAERAIGYAGMKDAAGVTRQTISVEHVKPESAEGVELDGLKIVSATRHTNKLKLGHLKGNRFRIVVRDIAAHAGEVVPAVLEILQQRGVPNYFGYQRYGSQGNSHLIGAAMLRHDWQGATDRLMGEPEAVRDEQWRAGIEAYQRGDLAGALELFPRHCRSEREVLQRLAARPDGFERAFAVIHPRLKKLYLSALQSWLFDQVVERRIQQIDALLPGDLAWKHVNGACFLVEDADTEAERARTFEISATGPIFGCKMKQPAGKPLEIEQQILDNEQIRPADFDMGGGLRMEGERRPLRIPLEAPSFRIEGDRLELEFSLVKGSYATALLREITKNF
ncbi:tRNA pseudouridine(13) synthase TruD [Oryzomonas japonica]|uniref:tRNA pseudouridine synthase D n=1 Tax=Oryzomonas japonica TaxID=2603858 RepID=A0A7J4ZLS0_9BACT|nr:tRNA pseudouridine(13) synthase TruD [Oryzomonas japonica]KAB0663550.1 tRNA pseudouridine(13) synthase TruD [Oryzomonas japonica]